LLAENLLLRQRLLAVQRQVKRPKLSAWDRFIMLIGSRFAVRWREATLIVQPATILRWHREGFRLFWRFKSRSRKPGRPPIDPELVELIQRMATENRLWGAERIRGELLKLGVRVAKRTIQKYMRAVRPPGAGGQDWQTFLCNHRVWGCDFLQVYDIWFRPLFAFFIIDVNMKEVVHLGVTRAPCESWSAQQLRNATPFGEGPEFIIRDRDSKFGGEFDRAAKGVGTQVIRTAVKAPLMNSVCERLLGSVRREALDHAIILGEAHLRAVLTEYVEYHNTSRPHQGLLQRVPVPVPHETAGDSNNVGEVIGLPVLGGLHHDYRVAA
jgi:transposase InsO family protein